MTERKRRTMPGITFLDFLSCLTMLFFLLFILAILQVNTKGKPTIETLGTVAVVATWPEKQRSDVDLWMQNPNGVIAYFANPADGLMFLEHDDLAYYKVKGEKQHYERMIIQQAINGEYTVNLMLYRMDSDSSAPVRVTVTLWRLRGNDRVITTVHLTLDRTGQEKTAFRFSLNDAGQIDHINHLQKVLLGKETSRSTPSTSPTNGNGFGP